MASTSSVSQANAELACSPRRSGENLSAPSLCHSVSWLRPSLSICLGTACMGGAGHAEDPAGARMDLGPVLEIPSPVTAQKGQGWDGGSTGQGRCVTPLGGGYQTLELRLEGVRS